MTTVGASMPVIVGIGADPDPVAVTEGTVTRSERHTPRPEITVVLLVHLASTQVPALRTWFELEQARHPLGPDDEQLEQLLSHAWHPLPDGSKNCPFPQVGKQRPLLSTGRSEGQLEHWLKPDPEHDAQSGWHWRHAPEAEKVPDGHDDTHLPCDASPPAAQDRQKVADPRQEPHDESHCWHVWLSLPRKVPDGQLATQVPLERTKPGRHPVHCNWLTVDATLKLGILQEVHFEGQPVGID
jgi:hypothetical protein